MNEARALFRVVAALVVLLLLPSPGATQTVAASKIGVISLQRAVEENFYYQEAAAQWTAQMNSQSVQVTDKQDELRAAQERLATQQRGLNERTRVDLVRQIEQLQIELDRMSGDIQQDLNALREQLLRPITERVDNAIRTYVEENGFTLILDASNPLAGVLVVGETIDITDEILTRLEIDPAAPIEVDPP